MNVTFKGQPVSTCGDLPKAGDSAPAFDLVGSDLSPVTSEDFDGRTIVLNIFPSLDTGTCAASVRAFNKLAEEVDGVSVICVSKDLPFAQGRFCAAEGIENVVSASAFRSSFGEDYGVTMTDGPLEGLLARSVVIIKDGTVTYTELVPEIADEPNYGAAKSNL